MLAELSKINPILLQRQFAKLIAELALKAKLKLGMGFTWICFLLWMN